MSKPSNDMQLVTVSPPPPSPTFPKEIVVRDTGQLPERTLRAIAASEVDDFVQYGFYATPTQLVAFREMSFAEYLTVGKKLSSMNKSVGFWIGDWINYAEQRKWGEKYSQALDASDHEYGTLRNFAYTARNVDLSRRSDKLSFKHHSIVAPLPPDMQRGMLAIAEKQGLSTKELDDMVKTYKREQMLKHLAKDARKSFVAQNATILHADARELRQHKLDPVDFIFTSPPYNVGELYRTHKDHMRAKEYAALMCRVYRNCFLALKDGGRIGVVVPEGVTLPGEPYRPVAPLHQQWIMDAGFQIMRVIVWDKGEAVAAARTSWGSYLSASSPAFRDRTERIIFAYKHKREIDVPPGMSLMHNDELFRMLSQDVWCATPAHSALHPCPFPALLPEWAIRFLSFRGAHVLDPFAGIGTTILTALRLECAATAFEIDAGYVGEMQRQVRALQRKQTVF